MKISASQAAKLTGKSVPTITRAIKKSKLSADPVDGGGWLIDPAELERVFPIITVDAGNDETPKNPNVSRSETPERAIYYAQIEAELKALRERFGDLEKDRDRWHEQATSATRELGKMQDTIRLIEDGRTRAEKSAAERPGFFAGLFGRKSA